MTAPVDPEVVSNGARHAAPPRTGLRIVGHRGHPEVRDCFVRLAVWLRPRLDFPVRCPVYLTPHAEVRSMYGGTCVAKFFGPYDLREEPFITIATGEFDAEVAEFGRDNALGGYIGALGHELVHYYQWLAEREFDDEQAHLGGDLLLEAYQMAVPHP